MDRHHTASDVDGAGMQRFDWPIPATGHLPTVYKRKRGHRSPWNRTTLSSGSTLISASPGLSHHLPPSPSPQPLLPSSMAVASFFLPSWASLPPIALCCACQTVRSGQDPVSVRAPTNTQRGRALAEFGTDWGSLGKNSICRESRFEEAIGLFLYYVYTVDAATPLYPSQRIL